MYVGGRGLNKKSEATKFRNIISIYIYMYILAYLGTM